MPIPAFVLAKTRIGKIVPVLRQAKAGCRPWKYHAAGTRNSVNQL